MEFARALLAYIPGFIAIALFAAIFGYFIGGSLVSHAGEYFGELGDYVSLIFIGPVIALIFGTVAWVRRDWVFLLYPISVFYFVGPNIYHSSTASALAGLMPFKILGYRSSNEYFVTVLLAYLLIYLFESAISRLARRGRFKGEPMSAPVRNAQITVLALVVISVLASPVLADKILANQKARLTAVSMPNTSDFISIKDRPNSPNSFTLYYLNPTQQDGVSYHKRDTVDYANIEQGKPTDVHGVCGDAVSIDEGLYKSKVSYSKTANGLEYGSYSFDMNASNPPRKTRSYTDYHACFVIDGKKYDLKRSSIQGDAYLKQYPTDKIVAAFADPASYKHCTVVGKDCSQQDVDLNSKLSTVKVDQVSATATNPYINAAAYSQTGSLSIKEWGIKFPLTDGTTDAYYATPAAGSNLIKVGLTSVGAKTCGAAGSGYGVAYVSRESVAKADADKKKSISFHTPNVKIGDYLYAVYSNGNASTCLGAEKASALEDIMDWASVNITSK